MTERRRGWRHWVATAAFLLALGLVSSQTCRSERASADIVFRVGDAGGDLDRLEAELYRPGDEEVLGFYRRSYPRGAGSEAGRWRVRADADFYRMKVVLVTAGATKRVERGVALEEGAVVTIDLEPDLAGR